MKGEESFCIWRNFDDYFLDWNQPADKLKRTIDAVGYPFAGAMFKYEDTNISVFDSEVVEDVQLIDRENHIGKFWSIENGSPTIVCGTGLLKLTKMIDTRGDEFKFKRLKIRL
jgi:methionyl-tRNA formyltransferase